MEVASLALAIPPMLAGFMTIVKNIDDFRTKYKNIPASMDAIAAYCGTVHVSMHQLRSPHFREALLSVPETTTQTMEHVEVLLLGCKGLLCQIEAYTVQFALMAERVSTRQRPVAEFLQLTSLVWKEPEIKELLTQLRDYKDGIDTIRQIYVSQSMESIQAQLSHYTSTLDILLERSRQSWNRDPSLIQDSRPNSLRFSFISETSQFSTTALYMNQDYNRQSTIAFDFDYEVVNSKTYKQAMADKRRRASIAAFRVSVADSAHILEEHHDESLKSVGEEEPSTDAHTESEAWNTPNQDQLLIVETKKSDSRLEDSKKIGNLSKSYEYNQQRRLYDQPPEAIKNISQLGRSEEASSSPPRSTTSLSIASRPQSMGSGATKFPREYTIAVLGGGGVDKANLVIKFIQSSSLYWYDQCTKDDYKKQCVIDDEIAMINILDTAGLDQYAAIRQQYMRSGEGFMLLYRITSRASFTEIVKLQQEILLVKDKDYVPMIVVGNHKDREYEREVSRQEGEFLARSFGCPFTELSLAAEIDIEAAFHDLVRDIRRYQRPGSEFNAPPPISTNSPAMSAKGSSTNRIRTPWIERLRGW